MNKKILYIVLKYSENNMNDATLNSIKNNCVLYLIYFNIL